jgi:hypothetical protein
MPLKFKIINIVAFGAAFIVLLFNYSILFSYLDKSEIELAYGYGYFVIYIYFPFTILSLILISEPKWCSRPKQILFRKLFVFSLISMILTWTYLYKDVNKILIKISNLSETKIENVRIIARNKQHLELHNLEKGQMKNTYCDCRDVTFIDSVGIQLSFDIDKKSYLYNVLGSNSNLFDQILEFRILKDTLIYRSYESSSDTLWHRIDGFSSLEKWQDITNNYSNQMDLGKTTKLEPIDSLTTLSILKSIRQLPIVQKKEKDVEHISKNKRHLKYNVSFEDSTKSVYDVLVSEDNGMSLSTHFNFRIDRKTLKILNLDGKY